MSEAETESGPELDLGGVARGWKTLIVTTLGMMTVAGVMLATIVPMQQVRARVLVERRELSPTGMTTASRDREFLPTQAEILASPVVITGAVEHLQPKVSPELLQRTVAEIGSNLKVDPVTGTGVLMLQFEHENSAEAVITLNALIDSYRFYLTGTERDQQQELTQALSLREQELSKTLDALQSEYEALQKADQDLGSSDSAVISRILAGLKTQLTTIQTQRMALERAVNRLRQREPGVTSVSLTHQGRNGVDPLNVLKELLALNLTGLAGIPAPAPLEDRLRIARARVSELSLRFGPTHPEMRSAEAAVTAAEDELNEFVAAIPATLQQTLDAVIRQEEAILRQYDSQIKLAGSHQVSLAKATQKLEEVARVRGSLEAVQAQLEQQRLVERAVEKGQAGIAVSVLDHPTSAEKKFVTNPAVVVGVAGLLGLLGGIFLLLTLPGLKRTLRPQAALVS